MLFDLDHVLVETRRLNVIHHRVVICEVELGIQPISRLDHIVVKPSEYNNEIYKWLYYDHKCERN